jgi:capsular polysaccharide biosynthesis protein
MALLNRSTLPNSVTPIQRSSETYPSLNIRPLIAICTALSILLGIMFYVAILKILDQIRGTLPCKKDVDQISEMTVYGKSIAPT